MTFLPLSNDITGAAKESLRVEPVGPAQVISVNDLPENEEKKLQE